jgi:tetraacyldisaccharide 4'-kinase
LPQGRSLVAFAGIGRPGKFSDSLAAAGATIAEFQAFADHHRYTVAELDHLWARAQTLDAALVTTEKDWVRLDRVWRARVRAMPLSVTWQDEGALGRLLAKVVRDG